MDLLEKKIAYSVKKLIAINSISYCYTELPIDQHCALFGRNNLGKTSLLNALKLHLFPEISFTDCKNKFAFKSSKGEMYSTEDSYNYYFPSDSSFLILEAENIYGPFCLVLFKSDSSFGYQRLALPCEYSAIRKQFWNIDNVEMNNGLGSPVSDLGLPKIYTLYQEYKSSGAELLKTKKDIKEKLFSHNPMQRSKGRYCLVPLKEGGVDRELSAFRQLMNFTFEIAKTDTKALTETFATIIESGKINNQDKLHQDLQKILDDYNDLRLDQDTLKAVANYRDEFKQLNSLYQLKEQEELIFSTTYQSYSDFLRKRESELILLSSKVEPEVNRLLSFEKELNNKCRELENRDSEYNGQLKTINSSLNKLNETKTLFQSIQNEYSETTIPNLRNILECKRDELNEKITHLNDKQKAIDTLTSKVSLQQSIIAERRKKEKALESHEKLLISHLNPHSATVLSNINKKFSEIVLEVNEHQAEVIHKFSHLFSFDDSGLMFLGEEFSTQHVKLPQQIKEELQQELEDLKLKLRNLDLEIQELRVILSASGEYHNNYLIDAEKQKNTIIKYLVIINGVELANQDWQAKTIELKEINDQKNDLLIQLEETKDSLNRVKSDLVAKNENLNSLVAQKNEVVSLNHRLYKLQPVELIEVVNQEIASVSGSDLSQLESNQAKLNSLVNSLNNKLNEFIQCGCFSLPVKTAYYSYSKETQRAIIETLATIFLSLHDQQENLQSRIIEHNKMTGAKIGELTGNRGHIRSFINKVNKQFEDYSISNLKEIRVEIELDHRFEELVNELEHTNLNTIDIHDDALYQRLNQFCEDFFIGIRGNRILEMSKIIKNVKYTYKKEHQDKREEKDQSTGTNALINCTLLTILMRDLLAQETTLKLPVIFDEFTALDEYNQKTAIKAATEHGFSLFCASPTVTAEVVSVVDYYITLDDFHANTIYDASGERDVVFHHFWERLYEVAELDTL